MNILGFDLGSGSFSRGPGAMQPGQGSHRASVRENATRHYWNNRPFDYAGMKVRRHELGLRRAKRWKKAHPGVPFTEAPRHIIENQKAK